MAYTALYRKWRPTCFDDVKGQDPIVRTLKNQIKTGRIAHAYLFCGSRGTGKTTLAKIFAKAVNCENPSDGSPCGKCDSCKSIDSGASMNVFELDAASNNGVDFVRQLLDEIQYPPTQGRYRVYIVDEVHMFSTSAFNALLKTLEEPPEYCIFILATTEPHKIPATILSRCQQYDFRRIETTVITERLKELAAGENIKIEDRALEYIAGKADGGMRDAISLLDQAAAGAEGMLTYDDVLAGIGAVDNETFSRFFELTVSKDAAGLIKLIDEVIMSGRDIMQFARDFTWYLRNILLIKAAGENAAVDASTHDRQILADEANKMGEDEIIRLIKIYSASVNEMRQASSRRVIFEITAIKSIRPEADISEQALGARINALEEKIASGVITAPAERPVINQEKPAKEKSAAKPEIAKEPEKEKPKPEKPSEPEKVMPAPADEIISHWDEILSGISGFARASARLAIPVQENETLFLDYEDDFEKTRAEHADFTGDVENIIKEKFGKSIKAVIRKKAPDNKKSSSIEEDIFSVFGNNIEIEGE